jgi:starch synthase
VPGTSEVIDDGVTGRLVEPGDLAGRGDTRALAAAILEPLEDPDLAARWGAAGRDRAERDFSAKRMAQETAGVYDEVLR